MDTSRMNDLREEIGIQLNDKNSKNSYDVSRSFNADGGGLTIKESRGGETVKLQERDRPRY